MRKALKLISFYIFKNLSRCGIYILPKHYYASLADINELEKSRNKWAKKSDLPGLCFDLDEQIMNLRNICLPYQNEYLVNQTYLRAIEKRLGPGYGYIEAQALHGFLRHQQPKQIIEVGSGVSTFCMVKTFEKNRVAANITCIEPHPSQKIKSLDNIELIEDKVQSVPIERFKELNPGDFLFIDSSHTVRPGGDVNYLILEILPRLTKGVFVHFHDIFLPYDYPRNVLKSYFQWMETSLLRAFLINNHNVRILFCLSQLHYDRPDALKDIFPDYNPAPDENGLEPETNVDPDKQHFPASIYLEIL